MRVKTTSLLNYSSIATCNRSLIKMLKKGNQERNNRNVKNDVYITSLAMTGTGIFPRSACQRLHVFKQARGKKNKSYRHVTLLKPETAAPHNTSCCIRNDYSRHFVPLGPGGCLFCALANLLTLQVWRRHEKTIMISKNTVFWDVKPCNPKEFLFAAWVLLFPKLITFQPRRWLQYLPPKCRHTRGHIPENMYLHCCSYENLESYFDFIYFLILFFRH
jgi:hypothetical protein